jgi:NAD(P)-dependent dehydrogenase (short-subunit alcohol dehydrogenase family)
MRILITGAARAIGAATATALTARGHEVVATARDVDLLSSVVAAQRLALDVTDCDSISAVVGRVGELDAVVNNAAISGGGPLEDFPLDRVKDMVDTNVLGPLRLMQSVAPAWRERGHGVIVNVSSVQGRVAAPLSGPYCATKFALEALSESMHYELAHFGVRIVIVEPGYTAPGMKSGPRHDGPPAYAELWEQWSDTDAKVTGPGGRPGPESVALAIADAIEDPATPLRVPVGADAHLVLATRQQLGDAAFEAALRATLDVSW